MNARQKAKFYKKIAKRYEEKANSYDNYMRGESFKEYMRKCRYGTIETLKVAKYWDEIIPKEIIKRETANEFVDYLLREGYIDFEFYGYNEYNMMRRVVASIKVAKSERG